MKQTVDFHTFREAFRTMGRYDQFGHEALEVMFDYLEEAERDTGEELELDVIALCCDYVHERVERIAEDYCIDLSDCEDKDDKRKAVKAWLNDHTAVCGETDHGIVYCTVF